jgi:predicted permease
MSGASRFDFPMTYFNVIAPGYFETLGIPLVRGRAFRDADAAGAPLVAVVNETAARRWWPGAEPLGKRFRFGGTDAPEVEVVGVAKDVKYNFLGERTPPFVYVPLAQQYRQEVVLQVRTTASPAALRGALWETVRALDPALPPSPVKAIAEDMSISLVPARAGAGVLGVFGLSALLLAAVGIYGVTSYAVSQRTRELGIRAALGARRADLLRMVVGETMRVVAAGGAVGIALALGAGYVIRGALYGVSPLDPAVVVAVPAVLAAAALVASAVPARRATRADPMAALRAE